jgi:hypothetical protein
MANYKNIDIATEDLDELIDQLETNIKNGGFNNDNVIWLIKAWTKVITLAGLTNELRGYWIMNRPPTAVGGKRSQVLLRALEAYSSLLEKGVTSGDFYTRARDSMLNFVWDYRHHISGKQEMDFVHQLQRLTAMNTDQSMQEKVFKMDQSI